MRKKITKISMLFLFSIFAVNAFAQLPVYVNHSATGANDGTSWANAYTNLQVAIDAAASGAQVWVAQGTYHPTKNLGATTHNRDKAFILKEGVRVYGGFMGNEDAVTFNVSTRTPSSFPTILSGDFLNNDVVNLNTDDPLAPYIASISNNTENAIHVVISPTGITSATILDGFTIKGGYANDQTGGVPNETGGVTVSSVVYNRDRGAGIYARRSSPTLNNLIVKENQANNYSGIAFQEGRLVAGAETNLSNSTVQYNIATSGYGGGLYVLGNAGADFTNKIIINKVTFSGNRAITSGRGGAINVNSYSDLTFEEVTFIGNRSEDGLGGGAIYATGNSARPNKLSINNTTFVKNTAITNTNNGGGAIYFGDNTNNTFINVFFKENNARNGAGIFTTGGGTTSVINNAIFNNNQATGSGGAVNASGSVITITGATIYGNSAANAGGAINAASGTINVHNTIILGNTATTSPDINVATATLNIAYSLTQGAGNGNTGVVTDAIADNVFLNTTANHLDFLKLKPDTENPAIDAGSNALISLGIDKDITGTAARIFNSKGTLTVDMGAYENATTPLPVELIKLNAKKSGNAIVVEWATASETNNDYFLLERSLDAINFVQVAKVLGKSANGAQYGYTDYAPANGVNYYRLTQVDKNGDKVNYELMVVNFSLNAKNEVVIYPNPVVGGKVTVSLGGQKFQTLQLVNLYGQKLHSFNISANETEKIIDISSYPSGAYFLVLLDGSTVVNKKIVKP